MSKDIDVLINSDVIVNSSEAIGSATQTNVLISAPVEVLNSEYTVSSSGLYNGSLLGGVPQWVDEAVTYNVTQKLVDTQNQFSTLNLSFHSEIDRINDEIVNVEHNVLLNLRSEIETGNTDILAELHQKYSTTVTTDNAIAELDTTLTSQYKDYTNSSIAGLNQIYKTIADADEAIVTAKTELTSDFNGNISSALVQYQTKSTAESAESQIRTDLLTKVNDSVASLSEVYQTKIDATETSVSLTNTLTATFNTGLDVVSAAIQTTEEITAGYFSEYTDTSIDPKLGQFKLVDGVQYQFLDGYLGINSDGWVRTDQSTHDYTVNKTNYLTDLVTSQATVLQGQIDGSITTWFDIGSPEFDTLSATYQSDTDSTDDNSQDVITGNFVWNLADNQMFKYTGSDANINLNSVDYVGNADWLAIYSINSKEKVWYDSDGIDTSNNYYWYEDGKIRPLKDTSTPVIVEERSKHIGDLYYDRNTGYAYRFAYEDIIDTPDEGVIFSWIKITDVDITKALGDAAKAQDTADGKRMVFNLDSVPTNIVGANSYTVKIDTGDLWIPNGDVTEDGVTYKDGRIYSYVKGHIPLWVEVANYKDAVNEVQTDLNNWRDGDYSEFVTAIQTQADMKSSSYYQEGIPHNEGTNEEYSEWVGDLWKKPSNNNEYIYQLVDDNYKWVDADVPDIVYDTIDTKKTIYTGNNTPNPSLPDKLENNDMWFTGSNPTDTQYESKEIYVYDSDDNTWNVPVRYTDDSATILLQTGLEDGTVAVNLSSATVDGASSIVDYVSNEIDKEVVVYSGTDHSSCSGMKNNDIYIEKTVDNSGAVPVDVINTYKYDGDNWVQIGDNSNLTALADLADGKRTIFSSAEPADMVERDVWIPSVTPTDTNKVLGEIYMYTGSNWVLATKFSENLTNFVSTINPKISVLENQLDGKLEYWFLLSTDDDPADNWPTDELKQNHHRDIKYETDTEKGYSYNSATSSWEEITDTKILQAYYDASTAQEAADGKVTAYYLSSPPTTGVQVGDLNTSPTDKVVTMWDGSAWVDITNATADEASDWAAGASKLIHDPNDPTKITGWSFADGSGVQSQFKISAENILMDGDVTFVESGADISTFINDEGYTDDTVANNAKSIADTKVSASQVNTNVTSIDGSVITTGIINAASLYIDGVASASPGYYQNFMSTNDYVTLQLESTRSKTGGTTLKVYAGTGSGCYAASFEGSDPSQPTVVITAAKGDALKLDGGLDAGIISGTNISGTNISGTNTISGTTVSGTYMYSGYLQSTGNIDADGDITADYFNSGDGDGGGDGDAYGISTGAYKAYIGGGVEPFTGIHIGYSADPLLVVGDIVCSEDAWVITISQTLVHLSVSSTMRSKKVFGVVNEPNKPLLTHISENTMISNKTVDDESLDKDLQTFTWTIKPEYSEYVQFMVDNDFKELSVNALGEGGINVCNDGGNIEIGDYICSADVHGKGMKQDDDLLHNYTVAKALEGVIWEDEEETTKMIACTYHCG